MDFNVAFALDQNPQATESQVLDGFGMFWCLVRKRYLICLHMARSGQS